MVGGSKSSRNDATPMFPASLDTLLVDRHDLKQYITEAQFLRSMHDVATSSHYDLINYHLLGCDAARVKCHFGAGGRPASFVYYVVLGERTLHLTLSNCSEALEADDKLCALLNSHLDDLSFIYATDCDHILRDIKALAKTILPDTCPRQCPDVKGNPNRVKCHYDHPDTDDEPSSFDYFLTYEGFKYTVPVNDCPVYPSPKCSIALVDDEGKAVDMKGECLAALRDMANLARQIRPNMCGDRRGGPALRGDRCWFKRPRGPGDPWTSVRNNVRLAAAIGNVINLQVTSGNAIIEEKYKRKDLLDMTASARRGVPWKKTARFINGPEVIALFHEHINADYGEGGNDTINRKCSNQANDQLFKTLAELVHNVVKKKEACTECIIANTDNQDQPGIHWYTVMVDLHPCDSDDDINT